VDDFVLQRLKTVPLYAYRCTQCDHHFEKIQHFNSKQELVCPKCQGLLERPLTAPALSFKGAGFYVNDYAGKSGAPAAKSTPAAGNASSAPKTPCGGSCGAACPAVAAAAASDSKASTAAS
jgi:putative FmdB family regulatory protein